MAVLYKIVGAKTWTRRVMEKKMKSYDCCIIQVRDDSGLISIVAVEWLDFGFTIKTKSKGPPNGLDMRKREELRMSLRFLS